MNNREEASSKLQAFLGSSNRFLLLTGTHQSEKHVLAFSHIISYYHSAAIILLRTNGIRNASYHLSPILGPIPAVKTGRGLRVHGKHTLYVDSNNRQTWMASPSHIDVAVVYPLDSMDADSGDECVQDLLVRGPKKIFLISWADNKNFDWTDQFNPAHVVFDVAEENPQAHELLQDNASSYPVRELGSLPRYAQSTPEGFLVRILCRGSCGGTSWARLNLPYPGKTALHSAEFGKYRAKCLKCGYEAGDNYNWSR